MSKLTTLPATLFTTLLLICTLISTYEANSTAINNEHPNNCTNFQTEFLSNCDTLLTRSCNESTQCNATQVHEECCHQLEVLDLQCRSKGLLQQVVQNYRFLFTQEDSLREMMRVANKMSLTCNLPPLYCYFMLIDTWFDPKNKAFFLFSFFFNKIYTEEQKNACLIQVSTERKKLQHVPRTKECMPQLHLITGTDT